MADRRNPWPVVLFIIVLAAFGAAVYWGQSWKRAEAPQDAFIGAASVAGGDFSALWEPTSTVAATPELLREGQAVYEKHCTPCHGVGGDGKGLAAYLLYPRPRNFITANYRLVSTWEGLPTDEDIFRSISRGLPGSAMPSWYHLPERTRWALVHYLKRFSVYPFEFGTPTADNPQAGIVQVPPEIPYTPEGRQQAAEYFAKTCASCHGPTGKGDGQEEQVDNEGFPTRPRDLTAGIFKGIPKPEHVFRRVVAGMPGSPMPSNPAVYDPELGWNIVHYVMEMSSPRQRERVEMRRFRIVASRVGDLPRHPDDGLWREAERVNLHLMPLWWRYERPEELTVQAVHDGRAIALLLTWADDTHDHTAIRPQDFRDAAAIEFALTPDPPFFAMGSAGEFVNIWMWKSERQADLEPAFQELDKIYPNIGIDAYPNLAVSPLEQPVRSALTLESDPTFVTGWGAGNIVSDPTRESPAEDLVAQGFGTLSARPKADQYVEATGVYSTGTYRVLFRRPLAARGGQSVSLRPGTTVAVSFAVWNGSAGDRDGKKSVTIWQDLVLER